MHESTTIEGKGKNQGFIKVSLLNPFYLFISYMCIEYFFFFFGTRGICKLNISPYLMELIIFGGNERLDNEAVSIDFFFFPYYKWELRLVNELIDPCPFV